MPAPGWFAGQWRIFGVRDFGLRNSAGLLRCGLRNARRDYGVSCGTETGCGGVAGLRKD